MNTATIEVQYAKPPKAGKKQGTVKATTGEIFGIWPDKLGLMRPGNSYEIEFNDREFNGRTYRTIVKCTPHKGGQDNGQSTQSTQSSAPSNSRDKEFEFVACALPALIQICRVECTPEGMVNATRMLRQVYRDAFK